MTAHPGALIGLPPGVPNPIYDLGLWRDLLVVVAAVAAAAEWRGRHRAVIVVTMVFAILAVGFWIFAFGRPYGVLLDPAITRWAADVAVTASGSVDGFVAGEPGRAGLAATLVRHGVPADLMILAPTLLPLVFLPVTALLVGALARDDARWAVILWLGASTGPLDAIREVGLLPGLWSRPLAALVFIVVLAVIAVLRGAPRRAGAVAAAMFVFAGSAVVPSSGSAGLADALLLLTLDQWPWLVPAAAAIALPGLRASVSPTALGLAAGGAASVLVGLVRGSDALWFAHAGYRAGVLILAAHGLRELVAAWSRTFARSERARAALGAGLVFAILAGSFIAWWDPTRMDPLARESLEPIAPGLLDAMEWVRAETPPGAAFVTAHEYAPAVAILGGRRVLRAPDLVDPPDDERRLRTERAILAGRPVPELVRRYGVRYVLAAPGQFREHALDDPAELEGRGGLRLVYSSPRGLRVYEIGAPEAVK